ncbi:hypothetical protein BK133_00945 [Paenibacillus sp. FSL H8-0548]|uniref:hypothetical protein n=1 Tax=Paenibacillus sp. FSL H8-0548 TaxID=1920422 RepID=UPI00096EF862|nr:hypothetical protein [Paenibacillus sp. FSL H8-0548]OMF38801.1 hypothetical protein BK133_00945 [Paenibacillus sp. FSL H8-0548]
MSEKRDLQADRQFVRIENSTEEQYLDRALEAWPHAIDRAIAAEKEAEEWKREALQLYPTPDAYDAACAALEKHRQRADAAEKERDELRKRVEKLQSDKSALIDQIDEENNRQRFKMDANGNLTLIEEEPA